MSFKHFHYWGGKCKLFIILLFVLICPLNIHVYGVDPEEIGIDWWDIEWPYRRAIQINSKLIFHNLTDFPVLLIFTDSHLAENAQLDGDDIVFTDVYQNRLSHEIEYYNSTNGFLIAWVRVPHLDSKNDTKLYLYYGNSGNNNQEASVGVWDENYQLVYHLNVGESIQDSTDKKNDGLSFGVVRPIEGIVHYGLDFYVRIDRYDFLPGEIETPDNLGLSGFENYTASFWLKLEDTHRRQTILNKYSATSGQRSWFIGFNDHPDHGSTLEFFASNDGATYVEWRASFQPSLAEWSYVSIVWNSGQIPVFYIDGYAVDTIGSETVEMIHKNSVPMLIGNSSYAGNRELNGFLDEIRLSNSSRSGPWILTEYLNQKFSDIFSSLGALDILPAPPNIYGAFPSEKTLIESEGLELSFSLIDFQNDLMNYSVVTVPDVGGEVGVNIGNGVYAVPLLDVNETSKIKWRVQVTDGVNTISKEFSFTYVKEGEDVTPPIADAGPDITIDENVIVLFNGSSSTDNEGIYDYIWTFYDITERTLTGVSPGYIFSRPGIYSVILKVTDLSGFIDENSVLVTVKDITKPVAVIGKDRSVYVNEQLVIDGEESSDNVNITFYEWDFGDGTIKNGSIVVYAYSDPGIYNVTLIVRDSENNDDIDWMTVEVFPQERSETYLTLIFIVFALVIIIIGYTFFIRRVSEREKPPIYRLR